MGRDWKSATLHSVLADQSEVGGEHFRQVGWLEAKIYTAVIPQEGLAEWVAILTTLESPGELVKLPKPKPFHRAFQSEVPVVGLRQQVLKFPS